MAQDWLLIETLGAEPTVVAVGRQPKKMVPLPVILHRNRYLPAIAEVITRTVTEKLPITEPISGADRVIITQPLVLPSGEAHGLQLWFGSTSETPPERPIAGTWAWNIVTGGTTLDEGCLHVNGITNGKPGEVQNIAESFQYIEPNPDEADALAKLVTSAPGEYHCATWDGKGDDDLPRRVHFCARICTDPVSSQNIVRGLNINVGTPGPAKPEQRPIILAQQLLAAVAEPGTHRALVDLRSFTLLKWVDDPMPNLAWQYDPSDEPRIHPEDLEKAKTMARGLRYGRTEDVIRLRSSEGDWLRVQATANLALLDQHTTAALVTLRAVESAGPGPATLSAQN
ncbi:MULTISPECIES: GAF domain-containing protein [Mycobacteroides]|nr:MULTISPECIES: GAF domain-containing protein [Mycobacteroides]MBE5465011.1 hypothetical protein [Mycobacteroides abscessus]SIN50127.1 Uncharacterised protein [Mycobacteroides abscessus subsp. abscessus]SKH65526.1 Uncharacterised protein [Mycobacteroides abscessus subsp. abscessus]